MRQIWICLLLLPKTISLLCRVGCNLLDKLFLIGQAKWSRIDGLKNILLWQKEV